MVACAAKAKTHNGGRQAGGDATLDDIDAKDGAARGVDTSRHFSYYAFEGKTGVLRWKHEVRPMESWHLAHLFSDSRTETRTLQFDP